MSSETALPIHAEQRNQRLAHGKNEIHACLMPTFAVRLLSDTSQKHFCENCGGEMRHSSVAKKRICDTCRLLQDAPASPPPPGKPRKKVTLTTIASSLAIFGALVFGGIYLVIPGLIVACIAFYRKEKNASLALLISTVCLLTTFFSAFASQFLFG